MRAAPASQFRKRKGPRCNPMPGAGTQLRALYDLFMSSKGRVIDFNYPTGGRPMLDLADYYGLDIRRVARGKWVLAGEWYGRVYLDYLAEHLASKKARAA